MSRCADGIIDSQEPSIREQILSGLLADNGGVAQIHVDQQKLDDLNKELRSFLDGPMNSGATWKNRTMSAAGAKENRSCATGEVGESEAGLIRKKVPMTIAVLGSPSALVIGSRQERLIVYLVRMDFVSK